MIINDYIQKYKAILFALAIAIFTSSSFAQQVKVCGQTKLNKWGIAPGNYSGIASLGNDRYAVTARPKSVEWASQNMLVLGIIVLCFLVLHLFQFWAKMQLPEIMGDYPASGAEALEAAFSQPWVCIVYLIGFCAIWFHITHGFWSAFQSIGVNNDKWIGRLKCIGWWWATIVMLLFAIEVIALTGKWCWGWECVGAC